MSHFCIYRVQNSSGFEKSTRDRALLGLISEQFADPIIHSVFQIESFQKMFRITLQFLLKSLACINTFSYTVDCGRYIETER